jgi:hypothetical protein
MYSGKIAVPPGGGGIVEKTSVQNDHVSSEGIGELVPLPV